MYLSDTLLITKVILKDDHYAFKVLIEKYQSDVRGLFYRLTNGNQELVDDLAQDTFIRVYKYLSSFNAKAKFKTWLFRIAYNVFYEYYNKKQQQNTQSVPLSEDMGKTETKTTIDYQNALNVLNENEKTTIILSYEKGFSHNDISKILNQPLGTVKTNILRGKEKLKKFYGYEK